MPLAEPPGLGNARAMRPKPSLLLSALLPLLAVAACSAPAVGTVGDAQPLAAVTAPPAAAPSTPVARGRAFAQAHCSGCHAVTRGRVSPNPESPPFETVVDTPGLTGTTLAAWLRDSHNFPEIMNFSIDPGQVDDLAAYMLTLRSGAKPVPSL